VQTIKKMLISLLILLLLSNALTMRKDKSILFSRVVILGLISTSFLAWNNLFVKPLEKGIGIYGGLFNVTTFTQTFNIFIFIVSAVILLLTAFYPRKVSVKEHSSLYNLLFSKFTYNKNSISNKMGEQFRIIEYALIIVFILCGASFLISTADLISIFLSIELQSYGLYILSTLYRDSELATGSGLTYFLLGGLSSCFILLGSALLYANSGTTSLDNIYVITSISEINNLTWYEPFYLHLSLIIMIVGFLFKVSAAPFHFWAPDVYDGIPTIVTTYVAIVAKISIFAFFLELVYYTEYNYLDISWKNVLLISSLFSLIIGSVLGLTQFRIKRLFAYSTISHIGFILLALTINSVESIQSYIFYILQYSLSNLNAFIILITIGYTLYLYVYKETQKELNNQKELIDQNNSPVQLVSQIKGYFHVNPFIAISLTITLFSFVGIPPVIGFFAKQMVLSAALDNGYVFMALVAILTSVIGAGYYLNLVKEIFFNKPDYEKNPSFYNNNMKGGFFKTSLTNDSHLVGYISSNGEEISSNLNQDKRKILFKPENITVNSSLSGAISIITLLLILFIYIPAQWFNVVNILTLIIFK
jgi:NADH-ubiquinone oxidoreductase chain 2